jgi:cytochrome c553
MQGAASTSTATYIPTAFKGKEVSYVIGATNIPNPNTGAAGAWVLEKAAANYDNDNVQYLEPDQTGSMYGAWCGSCHGNFHGNTTSPNIEIGGEIVRHPTAGVDIPAGTVAAGTGSWNITDPTHRLKVMDNTATWDGTSATMTPSCFSCHKSHGNANKFGLVFVLPNGDTSYPATAVPAGSTIDPRLLGAARAASMTEQGDGFEYRNLCKNCHGMGRWPTGNPTNLQH